jgi:hypothetical protein
MYNFKTFKTVFFAVALVALISLATSCGKRVDGSGNVISQTRNVATFTNVDMSGSYDVVITQDTFQSVVVKTDDNIMPDVRTDVENGTLRIYFSNHHWNYDPTFMTVYITSPHIEDLNMSGSGNITSVNELTANHPQYTISGSGNINVAVNAQSLRTNISGSGDITLSGSSPTSKHTISGSGNTRALNLDSDDVTVNISGSGDCFANADSTLNVTISGSGKVRYTGTPQVTTNITGSGNVSPY